MAGYGATGHLTVEAGSTLTLNNTAYVDGNNRFVGGYNNIHIGRGDGGYGYATVTGAGSRMELGGGAARLNMGRDGGYGKLDILDGGFVGTFNLTIGRDGVGVINVDGAGSELKTSSAYGTYYGSNYSGSAGYNVLGRGAGKGYLAVTNGGTVNVQNEYGTSDNAFFRLGRDNGSYGYALVQGSGSSINVTQQGNLGLANNGPFSVFHVGQAGQGKLIVEQGGR